MEAVPSVVGQAVGAETLSSAQTYVRAPSHVCLSGRSSLRCIVDHTLVTPLLVFGSRRACLRCPPLAHAQRADCGGERGREMYCRDVLLRTKRWSAASKLGRGRRRRLSLTRLLTLPWMSRARRRVSEVSLVGVPSAPRIGGGDVSPLGGLHVSRESLPATKLVRTPCARVSTVPATSSATKVRVRAAGDADADAFTSFLRPHRRSSRAAGRFRRRAPARARSNQPLVQA